MSRRSIDPAPEADQLRKGRAMVRHAFGLDPDTLTNAEFIDRWVEAAWLLHHRNVTLGRTLGLIEQ